MARPTDYGPQIVEQAEAFVLQRLEEKRLPTIEGLAVHLGVSRDTLYAWEGEHAEFSDMLEFLRATQGDELITNGLSGKYNASMSRLLLTKHGYRESSDITTNGQSLTLAFDPTFKNDN